MSSIPASVQSVLELFQGPLASVRFADVDAAGLASLAADVETAAGEVQRHEAMLGELRQGLAQRQEALLVLAQQALAYARVYAENDEELLEELNRISLPRAAKPRKAGAARATGGRDATRTESAVEGSSVSAVEGPGVEGPGADEAAPVEAETVAGAADGVPEATAAGPRRAPRKARGSVPQPSTN